MIGQTAAELLQAFNLQYGGRPPSWICKICKFSPSARFAITICMFLQKLRRDQLNSFRVIVSFRFPIWRPSAILDVQNVHKFLPSTRLAVTICVFLQNFVAIG